MGLNVNLISITVFAISTLRHLAVFYGMKYTVYPPWYDFQ